MTTKKKPTPTTELRRIKRAVKNYCKECSGGVDAERERCTIKACPLWEYRK